MSYVKVSGDMTLTIFDGSDYASWKKRILKFLEWKKCDKAAKRIKADTDAEEEWNDANIKAVNYIYGSISNKQLEYISDLDSAFDIMNKFDQMYLKESTALQIVCRDNLESIKLKNYSDAIVFFDEFEKAVNELKQAGAQVTEAEKLRYMLKALPQSYSHIGDLIDVLREEDRTVDYLKSKIKLKYMEGKHKKEGNNEENDMKSNAFMAYSKKCYRCGKPGHLQKDCFQQTSTQQRGHPECSRGQSRGNYRGNYRGNNRGNYRGNYRGNNRGNYRGNYRGTIDISSSQHRRQSEQHGERGNAFVTQVNVSEVDKNLKVGNNQVSWILDSGCTDHIVNDDKLFDSYVTLKEPIEVRLGDGRILKATKVGKIITNFEVFGNKSEITLFNVYYVKDMSKNLISYSKVTKKNKIVSYNDVSKIYNQNKELIAIAFKRNNLYYMKSDIKNYGQSREINSSVIENYNNKQMSLKEKWHRILGHVNFNYLNTLCKNQLLQDLPNEVESKYMKCTICIESKMCNKPFENNRKRAKNILEIVHTDLNGPHPTEGYQGEKYFLTFIDDFSKLAKIYTIKSKSDVYNYLIEYVNLVENLTGKKVKNLRCDNGKEYLNSSIYEFVRNKGIHLLPCPSYVHKLNGVAERYNRSIMDISRCLMKEAKVSKIYWPEIVKAAAYLKNRTLACTTELKTPFEIFFNERPSVKHLRLYGSKVFVRIPEQLRKSKWDNKASLGVLLGYTEVGYRVLINNRVITARHVDIVEENTMLIGFNDEDCNEDTESEYIKEVTNEFCHSNESKGENVFDEIEIDTNNKDCNIKNLRRSTRINKPNSRYVNEDFVSHYIYVNYCNAMIPSTYKEAINSSESKDWKKAMDNEIKSLNENKTWKLVKKPKDKKIIDVKWIYKKKNEHAYKARLVVRGFQQEEYLDNVYSPVSRMQTLKTLLSYCCQNNFTIEQMDVETAFLNGKILSEVYVNQPEGYENGSSKVYRLLKALYGLRESPRMWYECFNEYMENLNFKRSNYDYCLFTNSENDDCIYILLFVDDMLICSKNQRKIDEIKEKLSDRFKMKDMGKISNYIGIDVDYDINKNLMKLSQTKYIDTLVKKYSLENAKLYNTPMEVNLKLDPAEKVDIDIKYRNLIGELLYISTGTRPDIAFSVNYLSRFQNCYNDSHFKYALRILKYLYLTKDLNLTYNKNEYIDTVDCFVDADWAGDTVDRKSTSGYVIRLFGNVIYWKTHKQSSVVKSSTFAEYVALSEAVTDVNFICKMLNETFNVNVQKPVKLYEDNSGALIIAKYGNFSKNSKHIEVQYHYVNENYVNGLIDIIKVESDNNIADIFTKSLCKVKFIKFREMLKLKI